jgi:hypothetical protein
VALLAVLMAARVAAAEDEAQTGTSSDGNTASPAAAGDAAPAADAAPETAKYLLRYKFEPGEVLRWKVVHQALVRTTVSGTTQTAETRSESVKLWQVNEVDAEAGNATFVHSVESVDMRQSVSGRQDVRFNSLTDAVVPPEFEEVAKSVAIPLSVITIDRRGHVVKRHEERAQPNAQSGEMAIPLPEKEVAVGEIWTLPHDTNVRQKDGSSKQVKTRQEFTLIEVAKGIATIRIETIVLTPVRDPALEAQLIQHVTDGTVRFDIVAGRVVGQQTDIDKRVIGFQGEASSLHYVTRFTEEYVPKQPVTAMLSKPAAKPAEAVSAAGTKANSPASATPAKDGDAAAAAAKTPPTSTATTATPKAAATTPGKKGAGKPATNAAAGKGPANKTAAKSQAKSTVRPPAPARSKTGSKPNPAQQNRR